MGSDVVGKREKVKGKMLKGKMLYHYLTFSLLLFSLLLFTFVTTSAQELPRRLGGENGPAVADKSLAKRPVPKLPDGTVDLYGLWRDGGEARFPNQLKPGELDSLLLPWAKQLMATRKETDNPYFYCMPGGPIRLTGGFGWRFLQHPTVNAKYIFQIQEGNSHSYRQIFMDGRKHPEDPSPTWYGHSIGRWEGPTLVIDTIGLNDKFWMDRNGTPHTEQLHLVERWTRDTFISMQRAVTVDDPGAFTRPFTVNYTANLADEGQEILEYFCVENNQYGLPGGITNPKPAGQ
jgi:hypothetical protein